MKRLQATEIKQQIDALLCAYPELAEDEILRGDMFEGETDLHDYLRRLERVRRAAVGLAESIDAQLDELTARRDRFRRRDQAMRSIMFRAMEWANLPKIELPEATLSIVKGSSRAVVNDEALIPDIYCRFKREVDKIKLKQALLEFNSVPGATLSNAEPHLMVKNR